MSLPTARLPDRNHPLPLWAQVLDDLRRRLADGEFAECFPTDKDLVEEYGVSRHTVRDAVRRLQDEGVLERERGRGSFVKPIEVEQSVGTLYSLFRTIEDQGYEQRSRVLHAGRVVDELVAAELKVAPRTKLVHLRRLRLADHVPVAVDELWLAPEVGSPLLGVDLAHAAVYEEIERLGGQRPTAGTERILPDLPTTEERVLLDIPARQAVFRIERWTELHCVPFEYRRTVVRGDRYSFVTRWSGGSLTAPKFAAQAAER
ncbi:MAG: GntR family transcriptional regulator [Ilumatobacteraceae bacterium]|jgi:GntR family transcriptional regulator|nr:GntR family transcriptional regulator [Ilumatobacteraceae bacterium]